MPDTWFVNSLCSGSERPLASTHRELCNCSCNKLIKEHYGLSWEFVTGQPSPAWGPLMAMEAPEAMVLHSLGLVLNVND